MCRRLEIKGPALPFPLEDDLFPLWCAVSRLVFGGCTWPGDWDLGDAGAVPQHRVCLGPRRECCAYSLETTRSCAGLEDAGVRRQRAQKTTAVPLFSAGDSISSAMGESVPLCQRQDSLS